jgi:hypothetical protein
MRDIPKNASRFLLPTVGLIWFWGDRQPTHSQEHSQDTAETQREMPKHSRHEAEMQKKRSGNAAERRIGKGHSEVAGRLPAKGRKRRLEMLAIPKRSDSKRETRNAKRKKRCDSKPLRGG